MGVTRQRLFLLDACVLIDFQRTDPSVIRLVVDHVADVYVATTVLAEVKDFDESEAISLGIQLVEPTLELAQEAATHAGGLSFQDRVCLLLARENGWTCVSNDRHLRKACTRDGVEILWVGLIRFRRHLSRGGYDGDRGCRQEATSA